MRDPSIVRILVGGFSNHFDRPNDAKEQHSSAIEIGSLSTSHE